MGYQFMQKEKVSTLDDIRFVVLPDTQEAADEFVKQCIGVGLDCELVQIVIEKLSAADKMELYQQYKKGMEEHIEYLIKKFAGEEKVPVGTKVSCDGKVCTIEEVVRHPENPFGSGWYRYTIDGNYRYRREFTIAE